MKFSNKQILVFVLSGIIGAAAGFAYYYFIGCKSGTCPIKSNWKLMSLIGLISGLIVGFPTKTKSKQISDTNSGNNSNNNLNE